MIVAKPPLTDLPPLAQIGFVVPDLTAALAAFTPLYGSFHTVRYENKDFDFRGSLADSTVDVAFGFTGTVEIELVQPISGRGPHQEFLDSGRSGMHHLQYRFANLDPTMERLKQAGFVCIWSKRSGAVSAIAYMASPNFPLVIELVEPLVRVRPKVSGA